MVSGGSSVAGRGAVVVVRGAMLGLEVGCGQEDLYSLMNHLAMMLSYDEVNSKQNDFL